MKGVGKPLGLYITLIIIASIIASLFYLYNIGSLTQDASSENVISEEKVMPSDTYLESGFRNLRDYENFKPVKPVFCGKYGNTSVGCTISAGYLKPGEEVYVKLGIYRPEYYDDDYIFMVKLYRMEGEDLILINATSMGIGRTSFTLPMDDGVKYLLVVEAWKGDMLVDLTYSLIFVPKQYLDAEIYLDKRVYRTGDTLFYTIVNTGGDPVILGICYEIYRWDGEKWVLDKEATPKICPLLGIILEEGGRRSFAISLEGVEPGLYRLSVEIEGVTTDISKILEAEFIVEEY